MRFQCTGDGDRIRSVELLASVVGKWFCDFYDLKLPPVCGNAYHVPINVNDWRAVILKFKLCTIIKGNNDLRNDLANLDKLSYRHWNPMIGCGSKGRLHFFIFSLRFAIKLALPRLKAYLDSKECFLSSKSVGNTILLLSRLTLKKAER